MSEEAQRALEEVLNREIDAARSLAAVLEAERAGLGGDSPDALLPIAAQKTQLAATLEELEVRRRTLASAAPQGLPGAALAERWNALKGLMAACRTANEINGYIIHTRRAQIGELLAVVRGGAAQPTYTAQGRTSAKALRALAKA